MGVLQDVLVDPELRRHLIINATRMNSYAEMKNEVEAAMDASDDMDPPCLSRALTLARAGEAGKANTRATRGLERTGLR